jgi:hypothetical protein
MKREKMLLTFATGEVKAQVTKAAKRVVWQRNHKTFQKPYPNKG